MRIERISDTQVKFILTREDFRERDLSVSELTYNSDKAQKLFREMMAQAAAETGFEVDQSPLVIEAVPLADSIMIIVSKVSGKKEDEYTSSLSSFFNRFTGKDGISDENKSNEFSGFNGTSENKKVRIPRNIAIYSFNTLDDVSYASTRLSGLFKGASSLHKYGGKYYICLQLPFKTAVLKMGELENILGEYGDKHVSNTVSRGFLLEHGEAIISSNAVNKLASI